MKSRGKSASYYRRCLAAIVIAGVAMHLGQYRLYRSPVRPLAVSLGEFPREIGDWQAASIGLDEEIESVLQLQDYWSATYATSSGNALSLFIGYYADESVAKLHQPTICYPAAGWTLTRVERMRLQAPSNPGTAIPVNRLLLERGEERQLVLYWFHYPGAIVADPSMSKLHRLKRLLTGGFSRSLVKVQIGVPMSGSTEEAMARAEPFLRQTMSILSRHLGPEWAVPDVDSPVNDSRSE